MGRTFKTSILTKLDDDKAERARRNHDERIQELQSVPIVGGVLVRNISLANATAKVVAHNLGRTDVVVFLSPPSGASATGRIVISTITATHVTLKATGHGATITVNAWIF